MRCRICNGTARQTHLALILGKYEAAYWYCDDCEFWCTDEPHWLAEAYETAIADADTGLVSRNLSVVRRLTPLLLGMFGTTGTYVDYAGGYGLLVRLMRDIGLNFYWLDAYAKNLLAPAFEFQASERTTINAVTAVEVFEHSPNPLELIKEIARATGTETIIFTTELHDGSLNTDWQYLHPVLGQHVAFFTRRTLDVIGTETGMRAYSCRGLHILTRRDQITERRFELLIKTSRLTSRLARVRLNSMTQRDHVAALQAAELASTRPEMPPNPG